MCLSGGCVQNSVANGKILDNTNFEKIYISSSSGDSGGAIGSATYFLSKKNIYLKKQIDSYYGPEFTFNQINETLEKEK